MKIELDPKMGTAFIPMKVSITFFTEQELDFYISMLPIDEPPIMYGDFITSLVTFRKSLIAHKQHRL